MPDRVTSLGLLALVAGLAAFLFIFIVGFGIPLNLQISQFWGDVVLVSLVVGGLAVSLMVALVIFRREAKQILSEPDIEDEEMKYQ